MSADWKLNGVQVSTGGEGTAMLLQDVDMTFQAGRITLLLGHNGAGKSTLLETIAGIRQLSAGEIFLGDKLLWLPKRRTVRLNEEVILKLGLSMQQSEAQWFCSAVRDEFMYSLKPYQVEEKDVHRRIETALGEVGLPSELLERDPWTLSGGQQRRLSLACLLACEPDWLLLDEPTAGLDADGVRRLCAVLEAHRAAGRGAVVATHDLDALLPLADAVAYVSGGTVREAAPAAAAKLHAAAAPQALRALAVLRAEAALPPEAPLEGSGGALWPSPQETAAMLAARLKQPAAASPAASSSAAAGAAYESSHVWPEEGLYSSRTESAAAKEVTASWLLRPDSFDPRALIVVYLLLAASVLAQQTIMHLAAAAVLTLLLLIPLRSLIYPWARLIRAYVVLIGILCLIGALNVNPLSFEWEKALPIFIRFGKLLLIMLLGMPLLRLMSPMRLQRAVEQALGWLNRLRVPIHSFALLITLIFRFIPLLLREWERFAKLAHARGKATTPLRTVPVRMIRSVLIPYMRSILRLAEQLADSLEARGFGYTKRRPTFGFRLRFGSNDARLLLAGAAASLAMILSAILL